MAANVTRREKKKQTLSASDGNTYSPRKSSCKIIIKKIKSKSNRTKYQFTGNKIFNNTKEVQPGTNIYNVGKSTEKKTTFLQQINCKAKSKVGKETYRIRFFKNLSATYNV